MGRLKLEGLWILLILLILLILDMSKETFVSRFLILEISFLFLGISRNITPHKLRQFHGMFSAFVKTRIRGVHPL